MIFDSGLLFWATNPEICSIHNGPPCILHKQFVTHVILAVWDCINYCYLTTRTGAPGQSTPPLPRTNYTPGCKSA